VEKKRILKEGLETENNFDVKLRSWEGRQIKAESTNGTWVSHCGEEKEAWMEGTKTTPNHPEPNWGKVYPARKEGKGWSNF